jgi:hypothetical protein
MQQRVHMLLKLILAVFATATLFGCVVNTNSDAPFVGSPKFDSAAIQAILQANNLTWEEDLDIVWYLGRVTFLSIRNRNIVRIPDEIGHLSKVEEIDLQGNKIHTLSSEIGRLPLLEELNLRDNSLDSIPSSIGNLTALEELNLSRNRLRSVPTSLQQLTSLEDLFLEENFFSCPFPAFLADRVTVQQWAPKMRILSLGTCI